MYNILHSSVMPLPMLFGLVFKPLLVVPVDRIRSSFDPFHVVLLYYLHCNFCFGSIVG
jgi:hypothetical protein